MPTPRATPDIRELQNASLPRGEFPVPRASDFRVFFAADVHERIWQHAQEDTSVEVGGVLVGSWKQDDDGPFVAIEALIRCDAAVSKTAEVTFTHEVWAKINEEMDSKHDDARIVGWYHTHPDFGIFLSERDGFINQHFFSSPGQVAFVIDPIRETEGVFIWSDGKTKLCPHYWVGDRIVADTDKQATEPSTKSAAASGETSVNAQTLPSEAFPAAGYRTLLAFLAVFLIGYLLAQMRSSWEQQRLAEGAVAHYGIWKGLRPGLDKNLDVVDQELAAAAKDVKRLSTEHVKIAGEKSDEKKKDWNVVMVRLRRLRKAIDLIEESYCLSPDEAAVVREIIERKMTAEQTAKPKSAAEANASPAEKPKSQKTKPTGANAGEGNG